MRKRRKRRAEMTAEELDKLRSRERVTQKERRDYFKLLGRCIRCGEKDERTTEGKTYCAKCAMYFKVWNTKRRAGK